MNTVNKFVSIIDAVGSKVLLSDGRWVADFFADVGTVSLGYDQVHCRVQHVPNLYDYAPRTEAARRLCAASGMASAFFATSGAEAVESAIKLARLYSFKQRSSQSVIASEFRGFHGRTLATLACGDGPFYHNQGFGPLPADFIHFDPDDWAVELEGAEHELAAVLVSPINGNNDVRTYALDRLRTLRERCTSEGILFIVDEVQTGSGRAGGRLLYSDVLGLDPDIACLAKGVAAGVPCGVILAKQALSDTFFPGSHFSTFGGSPIAVQGVLKMMDWLESDEAPNVLTNGFMIRESLSRWASNVRGAGMLIAFDVDVDRIKFAQRCLELGVLVPSFRSGPGALKITPPLNIDSFVLEAGLGAMEQAYRDLRRL